MTPDDARIAALVELAILDTGREQVYEDAVALAAVVCGTPMAAITLLDLDRQWFKAQLGLGASETPRSWSFCEHAMAGPDPVFEIPDARLDDRFSSNPAVSGGPNVRFYAGAPLILSNGQAVGALCVFDCEVHELTSGQRDALRALGRQVEALLDARRVNIELARAVSERDAANARARSVTKQVGAVFDGLAIGLMLVRPDGRVAVVNPAMARLMDTTEDQMIDQPVLDVIAERDRCAQSEVLGRLWNEQTHSLVHEINLLQADGSEHLVIATCSVIRGGDAATHSVLIRCESIAGRRRAEVELRAALSALDETLATHPTQRVMARSQS